MQPTPSTLPWTPNDLPRTEAPLRSGGTPKAEVMICPGECRVPGLPNKASSRPEKKPPHNTIGVPTPHLKTVDTPTDGKQKVAILSGLVLPNMHKTKMTDNKFSHQISSPPTSQKKGPKARHDKVAFFINR